MNSRTVGFVVLVGFVVAIRADGSRTPIEKKLAGYHLENRERIAIRDERTGYILIRSGE